MLFAAARLATTASSNSLQPRAPANLIAGPKIACIGKTNARSHRVHIDILDPNAVARGLEGVSRVWTFDDQVRFWLHRAAALTGDAAKAASASCRPDVVPAPSHAGVSMLVNGVLKPWDHTFTAATQGAGQSATAPTLVSARLPLVQVVSQGTPRDPTDPNYDAPYQHPKDIPGLYLDVVGWTDPFKNYYLCSLG